MRSGLRARGLVARVAVCGLVLGLIPIGETSGMLTPTAHAAAQNRPAGKEPAAEGARVWLEFVRLPAQAISEGDETAVLRHLHAQAVVLASRPILERVVQEPSVRDLTWAKGLEIGTPEGVEKAVEKLRAALKIEVRPESGLISTIVRVPGVPLREEVALANALADVYVFEGQKAPRAMESTLERVLSDRLREIDAELGAVARTRAAQIRSRGVIPAVDFWSPIRVELEETARQLADVRARQLMAHSDGGGEPDDAVPAGDAPGDARGDARVEPSAKPDDAERLSEQALLLRSRIDELEGRLRDETEEALSLRDIDERRNALMERRSRTQSQLDDLQSVIASGPTVRVMERPIVPPPAEPET
ncbi:MAG: hypothetical protein ACKVZJ_10255 [Phycisphaerales bacterium]